MRKLKEFEKAYREALKNIAAFCDDLESGDLALTVEVHRGTRIQTDRVDDILSHLFQHQTHKSLGYPVRALLFQRGPTDEIALGRLPSHGPAQSRNEWGSGFVHIAAV